MSTDLKKFESGNILGSPVINRQNTEKKVSCISKKTQAVVLAVFITIGSLVVLGLALSSLGVQQHWWQGKLLFNTSTLDLGGTIAASAAVPLAILGFAIYYHRKNN